jgi:tRNA threonylcarbamoyladenosine biosynthesis protein TsaE
MSNEGIYYYTKSAEETIELGRKIGSLLQSNDIVALTGTLGAGKTTLIQGIAQGIEVKDYVTSPTFIIINEYQGRIPFFHIDLYRLNNVEEIEDLGIEEYFSRGGACVIEWAEKLGPLRPKACQEIRIEVVSEQKRELCVSSDLAARLK